MPTYEYLCQDCGKLFEHFQSMKDDPLTHCLGPDCRGEVKRLVSGGSGVIFKGSGFYQTDYKNAGGNGKGASKEKSEPTPCAKCPEQKACPAAESKDS